jgi:hypothetical protein
MEQRPKPVPRDAAKEGAARASGPKAAFDLWLEQKLHQLYDSVAQEPVPPELLDLIESDRTRRRK